MNTYENEKARYEEFKKAYDALMLHYPFTLENLPGEIWEDIPEYEGDYQESNFGRTKSLKNGKEKILKPALTRDGYLRVVLSKEGVTEKFFVHQLVAMIFIPNPNNLPEINHKFGVKFDNYYENLEWNTPAENRAHALRTSLIKIGTENKLSKLTADQVREIRRIYVKDDSEFGGTALARKFGVNKKTITNLVNYKTYKNVE